MAKSAKNSTAQMSLTDSDTDGFEANATYAKAPKNVVDLVGSAIDLIVSTATFGEDGMPTRPGSTVAIQGSHGTGKTSAAKAAAVTRELGVVYMSAPVLDITSLYCSFPYKLSDAERTRVKTILHRLFNQDRPFIVIADDFRRISPSAQGAFFEQMNEGTLAGQSMRGYVGMLCIDNPMGDGYLGVGGGDPAFETRFHTVEVDANGTPWRLALAAKYAENDLNDLFQAWSGWDPMVRRTVNPRVLDHLIGVTLEGLPSELGLPILPSGRQKIIDGGGIDVTRKVLRTVSESLGVPFRDRIDDELATAIKVAFRNGWSIHAVGPHAVGKTAVFKEVLPSLGADVAYLSMAHMTPADLLVTVPTSDNGVEVIPNERLVAGSAPLALVLDEGFRARQNVKGQMLEITQERSIGGVPTNAHMVIMLNNPAKWGDFTYPIGKADEALCSRFEINLFIDSDATPWKDYLIGRYGADTVHPFLEWRAHTLTDAERAICAPRVMEKLIQVHAYNMAAAEQNQLGLESALPMGPDGKRVPVRLHDLLRRLEGLRVLGFSRIVAESDDVLDQLRNHSTDENVESQRLSLEIEVTRALQCAEMFELEAHTELCAQLILACSHSVRIAVFRSAQSSGDSRDRQAFWTKVARRVNEIQAEKQSK